MSHSPVPIKNTGSSRTAIAAVARAETPSFSASSLRFCFVRRGALTCCALFWVWFCLFVGDDIYNNAVVLKEGIIIGKHRERYKRDDDVVIADDDDETTGTWRRRRNDGDAQVNAAATTTHTHTHGRRAKYTKTIENVRTHRRDDDDIVIESKQKIGREMQRRRWIYGAIPVFGYMVRSGLAQMQRNTCIVGKKKMFTHDFLSKFI